MQKPITIVIVLVLFLTAVYVAITSSQNTEEVVTDTVRTTETVRLTTVGLSLTYPVGVQGYTKTLIDPISVADTNFIDGFNLSATTEQGTQYSPDSTQPSLSLLAFRNTERLWPRTWITKSVQVSAYEQRITEPTELQISGAPAVTYTALNRGEESTFTVIAQGGYIFVVTVPTTNTADQIYPDYQTILESFVFESSNEILPPETPITEPITLPTMTPEEGSDVGTSTASTTTQAKINPQVACESALAYMTFTDSAAAAAFVADCVNGEHPEVIERYISELGIDGARI